MRAEESIAATPPKRRLFDVVIVGADPVERARGDIYDFTGAY